jgi:hypothetical protein
MVGENAVKSRRRLSDLPNGGGLREIEGPHLGNNSAAREQAGVILSTGEREGIHMMLRAYFDDSGTHGNSD